VLSFLFSRKDIEINVRYFPNTLGIFSKCFMGKISNRGRRYFVGLGIGGESNLLVYCSLHLEFLLIVAFSGIKTIFSLLYFCSNL
jgi:hypothetical protein